MNLNEELFELQQVCHVIAADKGWWETERNVGEMLALVHSEISEAWEEWLLGNMEVEIINGKPEGCFVELADTVIRILDVFHSKGRRVEIPTRFRTNRTSDEWRFNQMHKFVSRALEEWRKKGELEDAFFQNLNRVVLYCFMMVDSFNTTREDSDFLDIIKQKVEYNRTRPYRHGGKVA